MIDNYGKQLHTWSFNPKLSKTYGNQIDENYTYILSRQTNDSYDDLTKVSRGGISHPLSVEL